MSTEPIYDVKIRDLRLFESILSVLKNYLVLATNITGCHLGMEKFVEVQWHIFASSFHFTIVYKLIKGFKFQLRFENVLSLQARSVLYAYTHVRT